MELALLLQQFNLTPKQAQIYLTALQTGAATIHELAQRSGLKRPTVYLLVEELMKYGLMIETKGDRKKCSVIQPDQFMQMWQHKLDALEERLPELEALTTKHNRAKIQVFEGKQTIHKIYSQIIPGEFKDKPISFFGSLTSLEKMYPDVAAYFLRVIANPNMHARELLTRSDEDLAIAKKISKIPNPNYEVRFLDEGLDFGMTDAAIVGNKLYLFDLDPNDLVVVIESAAIVSAHKALYEMAWKASTPLKDLLKA